MAAIGCFVFVEALLEIASSFCEVVVVRLLDTSYLTSEYMISGPCPETPIATDEAQVQTTG